MPWTREDIAILAARELRDGFYVNLGIGMPTLVANHMPADLNVTLQSENGMLGIGLFPYEDEVDANLINAGKQTVTALPASSFFSSADSFAMIRGRPYRSGHSGCDGSCRQWRSRQRDRAGGGDQGHGRSHGSCHRRSPCRCHDGSRQQGRLSEIVCRCSLPLTGSGVVDMVITDRGQFEIDKSAERLRLIRLAHGETLESVECMTGIQIRN